jgi:peptide/nickel transport system ATP-binding protein
MYLGKICEVGAPLELFAHPAHPYTAALLAAIPVPDPGVRPDTAKVLGGEIPSPVHPPTGCRFRTRCPKAQARCATEEPQIAPVDANGSGHFVACHFPLTEGETLDFSTAGIGAGLQPPEADAIAAGPPPEVATA